MKQFEFDQQLREALHTQADHLSAPASLRTRIDAELHAPRKARAQTHRGWKKRTFVLAAVAALLVTGTLASGRIALLSGRNIPETRWSDPASSLSHVKNVSDGIKYVDAFSTGFTFVQGEEGTLSATTDDGGLLGEQPMLNMEYRRADGAAVSFVARALLPGETLRPEIAAETRTLGGVAVSYIEIKSLFLPPDTQPTADEQAAADRGELNIAYGSVKRSKACYRSLFWMDGQISYELLTSDPLPSSDDLFTMAGEIIAA